MVAIRGAAPAMTLAAGGDDPASSLARSRLGFLDTSHDRPRTAAAKPMISGTAAVPGRIAALLPADRLQRRACP